MRDVILQAREGIEEAQAEEGHFGAATSGACTDAAVYDAADTGSGRAAAGRRISK